MKQPKQRLVVLDYFRGLCILIILLSHSYIFSQPFAYLSGVGNLWTSAAEMFFLLSGITLGVVRGGRILTDFKSVLVKSWHRARDLYLLYIITALGSVLMTGFFLIHGLTSIVSPTPAVSGASLLWGIINFKYSLGLANFLEYYAVYMIAAPFILYALYKKYWPAVVLTSIGIYLFSAPYPLHLVNFGIYSWFGIWQLYFVLGMAIARFRAQIVSRITSLKGLKARVGYRTVTWVALSAMALSAVSGFDYFDRILESLTRDGWVPYKLWDAYLRLQIEKPGLEQWLMNSRTGVLRPIIALLVLGAGYLFYQKHKVKLLAYTGRFVTAMGRDTLWIFVAQAFVIPIMASLPIRHDLITNTLMTAVLTGSMWSITKRRTIWAYAQAYFVELKGSYSTAKYNYLRQYEDVN